MTDNPIQKILNWLRAGYPQGIPQNDYVALLGILHRSMTDEEMESIVLALHKENGGQLDEETVRSRIRQFLHEEPGERDVERVMSKLDAVAFPQANSGQAGSD